MNDNLAQHAAQTPSPSTGSRQATQSVGSAMSSARRVAWEHATRHVFSAPRRWVEMERDGEASASMGARLTPSRAALKSDEPNFLVIASEAKQSIKLQRKYRLLRRAALRNDGMLIPNATLRLAAPCARGLHETFAPLRAWGTPGARCTRSLVCACSGRKHTSNNEHTGITRRSRTQWFYDLFRALPGDRALLPPSSADVWLVRARSGRLAIR